MKTAILPLSVLVLIALPSGETGSLLTSAEMLLTNSAVSASLVAARKDGLVSE